MTTDQLREKFLKFFASKDHKLIESDSLIPKNDPTVLFTTAGMQQFKRQFLGELDGYTRAATSQKCLRTDDLDVVGESDCHHTFFEMLGNFSFGDYFKKDAISWAWEFLTLELKLPEDKLWVSVYHEDKDAEQIWLKDIKIPASRLVRLGDHDNFWPADAKEKGPNGPCGPCSEIFFDYGVNPECDSDPCDPSCSCGRFSEVWNLVFTQYNRKDGGVLDPLPNKNIDTGMGLERLAAVVQGQKSNYDTDIFEKIIQKIDDIIPGLNTINKHIVADHIRAITFGISDGVIPSNKERGYVIRGLINTCANIAQNAGQKRPCVYLLIATVVDVMKSGYPELTSKVSQIEDLVKSAETNFITVLNQRLPEFEEKIRTAKSIEDIGELLFIYRDTYGLPLPTMLSVIQSRPDIDTALEIFHQKMEKQKEQSRLSSKMAGDVFTGTQIRLDGLKKTDFVGYDHAESASRVLRVFINDKPVNHAEQGAKIKIILDKTPFYAESGGQVGDTGLLIGPQAKVKVTDTQKISDIIIHRGEVLEGSIAQEEHVEAEIDAERRRAIMRNHTATHLLQAALREVLGPHIQQQGSLVDADRLRFDFTHPKAITPKELRQIENRINEMILTCEDVDKEFLPIAEARKKGALAFFAEKYGDVVRIVSVGNISKEFCGGTHCDSTGEIGLFKIVSESAIAQGIRRLEAKTGIGAKSFIDEQLEQLNKAADILKSAPQELVERLNAQNQRLKTMEKSLQAFQLNAAKRDVDRIPQGSTHTNGPVIFAQAYRDISSPVLRQIADMVKQKSKSCVTIIGTEEDGNATLLVTVSDDLIQKGLKAHELIQDIAPLINGSGGGRPQMAQAGSKSCKTLANAIDHAKEIVQRKLRS